jgi:hypothetical protein
MTSGNGERVPLVSTQQPSTPPSLTCASHPCRGSASPVSGGVGGPQGSTDAPIQVHKEDHTRIRTITAAAAVAALSIGSFAGTASADEYVSDKAVPGHAQQERQGKVVTHYTQTIDWEGVTYDYVVNTVGDFGGDQYLNDGVIFNRIKGSDGSVAIYRIVHESHPSFTGEGTPIWDTWEYTVEAGNAYAPGGNK